MKERWEQRDRKLRRRRYGMLMSGKGFRDRMNELARRRAEAAKPAPKNEDSGRTHPADSSADDLPLVKEGDAKKGTAIPD